MEIEEANVKLAGQDGLIKYLGIEFISTPKDDVCVARMPVDARNLQPFGYLSGGATLTLAETLAGVGSVALCPRQVCSGITVNCNHIHPAVKGDVVTASARIIHKGKTTHVWQVEVFNQKGILISNITVTNFISPIENK